MESHLHILSRVGINCSQHQHLEFMTKIKNTLLDILLTLKEQTQVIKLAHLESVKRLNAVIGQREEEIAKLKLKQKDKGEINWEKGLVSTPYKMLLKNKNSEINIDRNGIQQAEQVFQIQNIHEQLIINQLQEKISVEQHNFKADLKPITNTNKLAPPQINTNENLPGNKTTQKTKQKYCIQQNLQKIGNCIPEGVINAHSKILNIKCNTQRQDKQPFQQQQTDNYSNKNLTGGSSNSQQIKSHFTRKPSNKNGNIKRGLFERKPENKVDEEIKWRWLDVQIPTKLVRIDGGSLR